MGIGAGVFSYSQIDLWIRNQSSFRQLCMTLWEVSVKVKGRWGTCTCLLETNHAKPIHRDISHKLQQNLRCLQGCLSGDNQRQQCLVEQPAPRARDSYTRFDLKWYCSVLYCGARKIIFFILQNYLSSSCDIILPEMVIINNYLK